MKGMEQALKSIKVEAADPAKIEQTLKDIGLLERDVAIAKSLIPPLVNRQTGDAKAESLSDYRAMLVSVLRTVLDLEEAVVDKKPDDIKKALTQLDELETQGHKEFNPPRNRGGERGAPGTRGAPATRPRGD